MCVTTKQKNLHKTLCDVTELTAAVGYSRAHFTRKFSEECGISPGKFLLDWRLRIAAQMLTADYSQIKSIARQTGFTDVSHFCRVFKQKYGLSPKAFRLSSISRNLQQNS
ncbi:MAG: helix-turn-helix transcriptional regulator [Lentisphaeria bacterium]|nr:helix-turn-helix transcriptional regulator [Lentisphaeria bacterium]